MRSLMWSVVYAMTLIGLSPNSVGAADKEYDCPTDETLSLLNCVLSKWGIVNPNPGGGGAIPNIPGGGGQFPTIIPPIGGIFPNFSRYSSGLTAELQCCWNMDNQCVGVKYITDKCTTKSGFSETVTKGFKDAYDLCKKNGVEWSVDTCAKLNPKVTEDCKQFSKYLDGVCNAKEVEARAGSLALVANWIYCLLAPIALIVFKYFN